jgi:signal transduction histidine kinase
VDLQNAAPPSDGLFVPAPAYCRARYAKCEACREFYISLCGLPDGVAKECPCGFTAFRFSVQGHPFALTCVVPWPRSSTEAARHRAKQHPETKLPRADIERAIARISQLGTLCDHAVHEEVAKYLSALHEIRKCNRTIRQEAERLVSDAEGIEGNIRDSLRRIERSAGLMAGQFEILELLANESIASMDRRTRSEVYKLFHKAVHIHEVLAEKKNVRLNMHGDSPWALVCDKTFPIIATVLIENAVKYSLPGGSVSVEVRDLSALCEVRVTNRAENVGELPHLFGKGVRGKNDGTGQGFGLYIAKLVARQHEGDITVERRATGAPSVDEFTFTFTMPTIAVA